MTLGPTFPDELAAAGLAGLPFAWESISGTIVGRENLTPEQNAALDAVIATHVPTKAVRTLTPAERLAARTGLTVAELKALVAS